MIFVPHLNEKCQRNGLTYIRVNPSLKLRIICVIPLNKGLVNLPIFLFVTLYLRI